MSDTQHTPGPWIVERHHDIIWIGTPKMAEIILHINQDVEYKDDKKVKNIANANLISAAPDMLSCLIDIVDNLLIDFSDDDPRKASYKAAIAKATGK